jgi:crotonobetainyl-CoA:carnitine CoA-transferase CaiB-like acyl-CoA transferase
VLALLEHADVLMENYKVGGLARYGLGYEQLKDRFPAARVLLDHWFRTDRPVCAKRAGYDFLIQGMGGIMSITGANRMASR